MSHENTVTYIILHDLTSVRKDLYDSIRLRVEEIIPAMIPGMPYTLEDLCGKDFWTPLSSSDRRLAGKCMMNLVKTGQIPLRIQGCEHQYPRKYLI